MAEMRYYGKYNLHDWSYSTCVMIGYVICPPRVVVFSVLECRTIDILGNQMTALYFRKFLLKTLNMPGKGFDSLLRPNNGKKKSSCKFCRLLRGNLVDYYMYMDLSEKEKKYPLDQCWRNHIHR